METSPSNNTLYMMQNLRNFSIEDSVPSIIYMEARKENTGTRVLVPLKIHFLH